MDVNLAFSPITILATQKQPLFSAQNTHLSIFQKEGGNIFIFHLAVKNAVLFNKSNDFLNKGFGNSFGLTFKMDDPPLKAYVNFQRADQYKLPTDSSFDYRFQAEDGDRAIPLAVLTYGMKNRDEAKMLLGIYNEDNTMRTVQIRYYSTEQDDLKSNPFNFLRKENNY